MFYEPCALVERASSMISNVPTIVAILEAGIRLFLNSDSVGIRTKPMPKIMTRASTIWSTMGTRHCAEDPDAQYL